MPELGGALRGAFTHKNSLGNMLVLTASMAAVAMRTGIVAPSLGITLLLAVTLLVVPTGSSTALMLLMLLFVLQLPVAVAKLPPRAAARALVLFAIAALAAAVPLLIGRNRIFMALGRDASLSGRTELWALVQNLIGLRPLQGYGYQAMFERQDFQEQVLAIVGWPAPNSHNGYLELLLGTGLVGLLLALAFLLPGLVRALCQLVCRPHSIAANFACVVLPIYLFRNFSEADLVAHQDITWVIAVLAVLCVSREAQPSGHVPTTPAST
jgi:O-antigen ligase